MAPYDEIAQIVGQQRNKRTRVKVLQGKVWLSYVLWKTNFFPAEFARCYLSSPDGTTSGLIYKWINGEATPSGRSVDGVARHLLGSDWIYRLPLWQLLEDRPITNGYVRRLLEPYRRNPEESFEAWSFPENDSCEDPSRRFPPVLYHFDSDMLFARGDLYGFMGILGLVREAEALRDEHGYRYYLAQLFRAFPAVARLTWIRPHLEIFIECLERLQSRTPSTFVRVSVRWDVIRRQIEADTYETRREYRPRDPVSGRFLDLEDPVEVTVFGLPIDEIGRI